MTVTEYMGLLRPTAQTKAANGRKLSVKVLRLMLRMKTFTLPAIVVAVALHPALAQKKGAAAATPAASPAASSGGSGNSTAPVEVEWLAYSALEKIMNDVADYACGTSDGKYQSKADGNKVVVLDSPALQALEAYDTFYEQAEGIRSAFVDMAPRAGAGSGIDDFSDITNAVAAAATASTTETASSFTIQDPAPAITLLRALHSKSRDGKDRSTECRNAQYAGVYEVSDIGSVSTATKVYKSEGANDVAAETVPGTQLLPAVPAELNTLAATRASTLMAVLGKPGAASNPKVCKGTPTLVAGSNPTVYAISSTDPCVAAFNNLDNTYNAFLTGLSTPNATTGQSFESAAKQGYKLRALFEWAKAKGADGKAAHQSVLGIYVNVAAAGGTQQDRKNLLTNLFTGDWIRYSGGVSLNVIVFRVGTTDSQLLLSGLTKFRTQLTTVKAPGKADRGGLDQGSNLDNVFPSEKR